MRCAILPCLGLLLVAPSLLAQPPIAGPQRPPGNPRREQLDAFGRKLPWGDAVNGSRVCLAFPTNRLLYGQPLQMMLLTRYEVAKPPYPRIQLDEPGRNATVEFTTDKGEQVPFSMRYGGGASGPEGTRHEFRLLPQGRFLRNLDLAPGHYRLRVVIDSKPGPSTRPEWIGKLVTNTLELIVVESTPAGRAELVPEAARELAAALGDPQAEKRRAAAQALLNLGNGAVPAVTDALGSDSPERRETAREVFRRLLTFWPMRDDMNVAHVGIVLAQLPDVGWKALPDNFRPEDIERLRTEAAAVGPVPMEPPPEKQLLAGLHDLAPHVRLAAARAVPPTASAELLTAVVALLKDPYHVFPRMAVGEAGPMSLIALEVGTNVGRRLGSPLVGPLLELLRKEPSNAALRYYALPLLGELGPDPRSFNYLGEVLAAGNHDDCYHAIRALGRMGKDAEPILLRVADDPGRKSSEGFLQRTMAIEALGRVSDASTLTPRLKKWLVVDNSNLVREAVLTADQTRASGVLPELTALARRPDDSRQHIWQNVHTAALTAVAHLADRDTAIKLLTEMLDAPDGSRRGMAALLLGSLDGLTAVPRLLDLLADRDWYVRAQSDRALQALARYPEGVRYDANKPNPEVWRKYWNDRN